MSAGPGLAARRQRLAGFNPLLKMGRVTRVVGLTVEVQGLEAPLGELCRVYPDYPHRFVPAEVVGFREGATLLMPLGELEGIAPGCPVRALGHGHHLTVGPWLAGRVLDGLGLPLDGSPLPPGDCFPVNNAPPNPLARRRIQRALTTGVKAIDSCLTCGEGQRIGIFAGSGVGKSTLLGMIARYASADVNVIGLVGERGREVRDFLEKDLGPQGLARSVVVVATSDQPPLVRLKAAAVATALAEYFRDQGKNVVLMMDSLTRFAMAQREVGLAVGEPPTTKGYPPSVFALLPRLLERAGTAERGSITGFYTVLVDGDDMNEPIADTARSILDGHIVLSRELANRNHYPAIDVLASVSRLMPELVSRQQLAEAGRLRELLATYRENEDLINIGAYQPGSNPRVDAAINAFDAITAFLRQEVEQSFTAEQSAVGLRAAVNGQ